ncbi:glycosyltransferase family 2 protein [Photobacterium phosphoreum]|uniref:glycosyltransferase family 2 protein n=1 Tax=Photobacterium phosphoreum TaxID=659 RepID=UPI001E3FAE1E|nr:glycosyltransferase family 2 protein [Photobacterium phosphoreum]MCD9477284.1 capsular biosynthesis protein [Photobacterium phosphoreum]MCF2178098.1 capsular biosynthesis protein [Photobacterium phosphoreum]
MIVIPMAGLSSRFFKAGYTKPKYMLEAHGITLFEHAVKSFEKYFSTEKFLFIIRDVYQTSVFVEQQAKALGIKSFEIIILKEETRGQAETVYLGLQKSNCEEHESLTIFNIDTFRPNFRHPDLNQLGDGYLEVFQGVGDNWSFAKPLSNSSTLVIETAEKRAISDLCCTGLYYFSSANDFIEAYINYLTLPIEKWEKKELYVAPLYNYLIDTGKYIHYNLISKDSVIFCGVPSEYISFIEK